VTSRGRTPFPMGIATIDEPSGAQPKDIPRVAGSLPP
jgi:hypothetical protein